jgi:hypothetical protein
MLTTMSRQMRPLPSRFKPSRQRPPREMRQIVVQEVSEEYFDQERLDRLTTLLSSALSRRLAQEKAAS